MFEIDVGSDGTIELRGRFDALQVDYARQKLGEVERSSTVDCAELDYISSAGLGILLSVQKRLSDAGHGLRLINLNNHIREVFRIAGFDQVFDIG
jgi:anti-anti-sigma factor